VLNKHGFVGNISHKGNCWDNAVTDYLFLELEDGAGLADNDASHAEATNNFINNIIGFYNSVTPRSKRGNMLLAARSNVNRHAEQPIRPSEITNTSHGTI
jgi:hypothetical protein